MIPSTDKGPQAAPIRILAVDDNPAALYATSRVLKSAGYQVLQATTGAAALEMAPDVDLIVLDVNLPDMDGFEVCRLLRSRPETAQTPLLHLSATFTQAADFNLGLEAGADSYLTRPVEAPVLIATVRTLLFAKRADHLRRGLDAKLRALFDIAPVGMAILDEHLAYMSVNPGYCALTGYTPEELLGRPITTGIEAGALQSELLRAPASTAEHWTRQVVFQKKDGSRINVEWRIVRVHIASTSILLATDITERLRSEQDRERLLRSERAARAAAERSNLLKEQFLATLSHELRSPLQSITGWAAILNRTPELPPQVARGLAVIERNAKIQSAMISDLLDYAGITFGKIRVDPERIDPYGPVHAAIEAVASLASAADIRIVDVFEDHALWVDADPMRLQQVVVNMLSNAIKFSPKGSSVEVHAGKDGEFFRIQVADHGKGIDPQFLGRIFERFSQQDGTTTRSHGGLGIGLAIVKQLVDLHGGTIEALSPGNDLGSTFTVRLPLTSASGTASVSDSQMVRNLDLSQIVVLLVEDDADSRALTSRVLSDAGATVLEADGARAALEYLASSQPAIMISDIGMAQVDGYELVRRIRAVGYDAQSLPAIALTAFSRPEDREQALSAGFQEHLVKPLDPHKLISRVAALTSRRNAAK